MNKNRIDYFVNLNEIISKIQNSISEIYYDISKNIKVIHCISTENRNYLIEFLLGMESIVVKVGKVAERLEVVYQSFY